MKKPIYVVQIHTLGFLTFHFHGGTESYPYYHLTLNWGKVSVLARSPFIRLKATNPETQGK